MTPDSRLDDRVTQLYRRYGGVIYMRCRSMLRDEDSAQDATQETFLRVHRALARVPADAEALTWIYRVATNYCLNELRDRKLRPVPTEDVGSGFAVATGIDERVADRELAFRLIWAAPKKVRPVAWLYHMDGFDQEEVASILELSRRTVATRLADFQAAARRFVRREGP